MSNKKSVDSDIQHNVVIDYDKDGKVVRMNIYEIDFESFQNAGKGAQQEFAQRADMTVLTK